MDYPLVEGLRLFFVLLHLGVFKLSFEYPFHLNYSQTKKKKKRDNNDDKKRGQQLDESLGQRSVCNCVSQSGRYPGVRVTPPKGLRISLLPRCRNFLANL